MRWIPLAALAVSVVSGQDIHYNYDRSANFFQFRTYKWVKMPTSPTPSQLIDQQIMSAVDQEMARKGFARVDGNADLLLAYQTSVQQEQEVDYWNDGGPWGWGPGW